MQVAGPWTAALAERVSRLGNSPSGNADDLRDVLVAAAGEVRDARARVAHSHVQFRLDGPHGRPTLRLDRCSTLVLFGGGIGCTPLLPVLSIAAAGPDKIATILPSLRHLVFVWSVRSPGCFELAAEELRQAAAAIRRSETHPTIEVSLHLTAGVVRVSTPGRTNRRCTRSIYS